MVHEQYIDIDMEKEAAGLESESYETIVLKQIRESAVALSKPRDGGQIIERVIKGKKQFVKIPDTREVMIRTVNTLRSLMKPFIKKKLEDEFEKIDEEKKKIKEELGEIEITIGKEKKKAKEFHFIPPNHIIIKMRIERECDNAERLFAALLKAFHLSRMELKSYETD